MAVTLGGTGEYAVAGSQLRIQLSFANVFVALCQHSGTRDAIKLIGVQTVAGVTPGIPIPNVAILHQPLRRNDTFAATAIGTVVIVHKQLLSPCNRLGHHMEPVALGRALITKISTRLISRPNQRRISVLMTSSRYQQ